MTSTRRSVGLATILLTVASACGDSGGPGSTECQPAVPDAQIPLAIAPAAQRVDLGLPAFSNPTHITNPLFPVAQQGSVVMLGAAGGVPLRVEVTLLPETRTIAWEGEEIETLVIQFVAYLDGRLHEVALDWYAQADDGAVWYFGEDVFNYENGVLADTEGTWLACTDGPPGMIMAGSPQVGDVWRPENVFGVVFEEVIVTAVAQTVSGPWGPVAGALIVDELHMDGTHEAKTFAPGYGEFITGSGADLEAVVVAVPTDAVGGGVPAALAGVTTGALQVHDAAASGTWPAAATATANVSAQWNTHRATGVPAALDAVLTAALAELTQGVSTSDAARTRRAAIRVALSGFDLQLRYRPRVEVDLARLDLWSRQLALDLQVADTAGALSDAAILGRIWERVAPAIGQPSSRAALIRRVPLLAGRSGLSACLGRAGADCRAR